MRRLIRLVVAAQLVAVSLVVGSPVAAVDAYTIVDLGTLGGVGSSAAAVNEAGNVTGTSNTSAGEPLPFRWKGGLMMSINTFGGFGGEGTDINDAGWIVGSAARTDGYHEAFYWAGADPHPIGTLGDRSSQAFAINNDQVIVGRSTNLDGIFEAFRWEGGVMTGLGGLVNGDYSEAWDVNDAGVIVGEAGAAGGFVHAFRHANGVMQDLGTPSPNFETSWARGINEAGVIVGGTQVANGGALHPFILANGSWDVVTEVAGYADAVNASGQVVGTYFTPAAERAFLYEGGALTDLNQLVPAGSGWQLDAALDINDAGQIVGQGMHDGEGRGFLLTPVSATADLGLTLTAAPDPALAGTPVTFEATITNLGAFAATSVILDVQLPVNNTSVACSADAGGICAGTGSRRTVSFSTLGSGAVAHATFVVGAPGSVADGASYGAVATVDAAEPDPVSSNNAASASVTLSNLADLGVTVSASRDKAKSGQVATQSWLVTNHGPGTAGSVVFEESLPSGVEILTVVGTGCLINPGAIQCQIGTLTSGSSSVITVDVVVTASGGEAVTSSGSVSSPTNDPAASNDSATTTVRTVGPRSR